MQSVVETIVECSERIQSQEATIETQQSTISNLNEQIAADDSNFDDIYDAIVDKGQHPTKADRTTYAPAIEQISGGSAVLDTLNVTPTTSAQHITPPSGTDGYDEVNVAAVDNTIDSNIVAGNIKNGVTILGVQGTLAPSLQTKSVNASTSAQQITPDNGYDGLAEVDIAAVTAAIDANIVAGNIKKDIQILGVTGTLEGAAEYDFDDSALTAPASSARKRCIFVYNNVIHMISNSNHYTYDVTNDSWNLVDTNSDYLKATTDLTTKEQYGVVVNAR